MRMTFAVDYGSGVTEVEVSPKAVIGYEIANKTKISRIASEGFGLVDMSDLVWRQLTIEGRYTGDLDAFRSSLRELDPVVVGDPT